jgi:molybdate transport system ATP-binding protein
LTSAIGAGRADLDDGVVGIVGPSGAGKSTLLGLLAGLLRPQRGWMQLGDDRIVDVSQGQMMPAWQRHIGVMFQDGQLFPHKTVRQNLLYGHDRLTPAARRFDLVAVTDMLEIGALLDRRPALLSGGERQRVALGRALLYSPRLLLLDEPLSSLDGRLKEQILPFLKRVKVETGIPMIYVSHALGEVKFLADRVLMMDQGRLQPAE